MEVNQEVLQRIIPLVKAVVLDEADTVPLDIPEDGRPVSRPLAGDLIVMYAEDLEGRFVFVSGRRMSQLGLTMEQLHELALSNLPNRLPQIEMHGDSPRHMLTCGGNFEATLLLHDGLWETIAEALPGQAMICVPARDLLFVSGSGWDGAHAFLSEIASRELEDKRYTLSKEVFVRTDGRWVVSKMAS